MADSAVSSPSFGTGQRQRNSSLSLAWTFALREMRGGLRGFYIFLACIALGVAAIAGVNSVARSITVGIAQEGQSILGGDISFQTVQLDLEQPERDFVDRYGRVSRHVSMRAMGRLPDGSDQTLIELKAVDQAYPLYGSITSPEGELDPAGLASDEAYVDLLLLERLGITQEDVLEIGETTFRIAGIIKDEPDRIGEGVGFGPRVMINVDAIEATGLIQPGSLIRYTYNLRLDDPSPQNLKQVVTEARENHDDSGWRVRSRENAAPALSRNIERFSQFLTLVGLTSLIVGGVGVANAIRAFLETKRPVIASFKALGASGNFIFFVYLFQIMTLAVVGIALGLVLGALMPWLAAEALEGLVPVSRSALFFPEALALGAVFGLLTALLFAIWPLAVAQEIPATSLFRSAGFDLTKRPKLIYTIALSAILMTLVFMAIFLTENRFVATVFIGAIAFSFVLLRAVSTLIQWLASRAPQVRSAEWRMAIRNIHRRGSLTPSVVLSLGLGLALLVALAMIDGNLRQQVAGNIPNNAPDFFFVDVQNTEIEDFRETLLANAPNSKMVAVPMLRGRVTELKGIASEDYDTSNGGGWVLRGDRGITYSKNIPENSTLAKGEWWEPDYNGPPLVSMASEEAEELRLNVGDKVKVNVLGRTIEAEIASLRNVEWESLGINFVFVFSPNTFAGAPHSYLATLLAEDGADQQKVDDGAILREVSKNFPAVTSVRVRDALDAVNRIIGQLGTAIRAAAAVALVASILVLGGALAAGNRARIHDSVVLKTLGAKRGMLMRSFIYEYGMLGFATAVFALIAGSLAAWFVISGIMEFPFLLLPGIALATIGAALVLTVGFGLIGTWSVLGQKAAPVLREL